MLDETFMTVSQMAYCSTPEHGAKKWLYFIVQGRGLFE